MTNDELIRRQIHDAVDRGLAHLDARPSLAAEILSKTRGEKRVKRKISAGLVLACALILAMTAIAVAATRFGVLDFNRHQTENEAYIAHILAVDETYENEYMTLTLNDAVFDGLSLSMTMDIQPKEGCGEGVYVYPRVTAVCNGKTLDVDIESCFGDFYNGFWVPERDQGLLYANGRYGADYTIVTESETGVTADPQKGPVTWTVSFDIIKPVYPVEIAPAMYDEQGNETMPWAEWLQFFKDAYAQKMILLAEYSIVEYAWQAERPQKIEQEEWAGMSLTDRMVEVGAFERVEKAEISFTTQATGVKSISEPQIFTFGDYEAKVMHLSVGFSRCDYEIEVTKIAAEGKTAGQEWVDGEGEWTFAVLADGCATSPSMSSTWPKNRNEEMSSAELLCKGTVILTGETDRVMLVPCWNTPGHWVDGMVYEAQKPLTPEQEEMAFSVIVK